MNKQFNKRRLFIKSGLIAPILGTIPWNISIASVISKNGFQVPENIRLELFRLYGGQANNIKHTNKLKIEVPDIAENGAVVPVGLNGEKGLVSSLALFVVENSIPLTSTCTLHEGSDLAVSLRIKMTETSEIIIVAQTKKGLMGLRKTVKVTTGCGGGGYEG